MPRLIRFPQVDEFPTPPAALQVDDGSESWWSGVQLNFAAIPIAATIAAIALSANLAWGYQQQTEDIVPQAVVVVAEDDSWQRPYSIAPPVLISGPTWDDQVRASPQVEEDGWWVYTPGPSAPRFLYLPDPEEVPAGSLHGPFEEDWPVPVPSPAAPRFLSLPDDEQIVPQPVVTIQDEDLWQVFTPAPVPAKPPYLPTDEEIVPQPTAAVSEEDYWAVYPLLRQDRQTAWVASVDDEIVPQPVAFGLDEEYWFGSPARPSSAERAQGMVYGATEDFVFVGVVCPEFPLVAQAPIGVPALSPIGAATPPVLLASGNEAGSPLSPAAPPSVPGLTVQADAPATPLDKEQCN